MPEAPSERGLAASLLSFCEELRSEGVAVGTAEILDDIPKAMQAEITHFFSVYKDLEPGKSVEGATWVGRMEAEEEIRASFKRAEAAEHDEH